MLEGMARMRLELREREREICDSRLELVIVAAS